MSNGIVSQYGFLFQRYVFIKTVINNAAMGVFFTYEGADDIEVSKNKNADLLAMASASNSKYVQVKSGEVSKECWAKVVGNWILLDDYQEACCTLFCENELEFDICDEETISTVYKYFEKGASKSIKSIAKRTYEKIFIDRDEEEIKKIIRDISQRCSVTISSFETIKDEVLHIFTDTYCTDIKIYEKAKQKRFNRFTDYVMAEIDDAIEKKNRCTITFKKLMDFVNRVSSEISDDRYNVNTAEIKKRKQGELESLMKDADIREIKQLLLVRNEMGFVAKELVNELLYKDFREIYVENGIEISNMEDIAHENYKDVLLELDNSATPKDVYLKTTEKPIESSVLGNSPIYRKGCYIFLTGDNIDFDKQISWGKSDE
jgi:REP element-mobilizing transposase RayT